MGWGRPALDCGGPSRCHQRQQLALVKSHLSAQRYSFFQQCGVVTYEVMVLLPTQCSNIFSWALVETWEYILCNHCGWNFRGIRQLLLLTYMATAGGFPRIPIQNGHKECRVSTCELNGNHFWNVCKIKNIGVCVCVLVVDVCISIIINTSDLGYYSFDWAHFQSDHWILNHLAVIHLIPACFLNHVQVQFFVC